jgi:hypothetical protein
LYMKENSSFKWRKENLPVINQPEQLNEGSFIWVINWLDVPPHLGISVNGKYYSATVRGPQLDLSVESIWRLCEQKSKHVFFIKINAFSAQSSEELSGYFNAACLNENTCLQPIKELIGVTDFQVTTLFQLIEHLESKQAIESYCKPSFCCMDWVGLRAYEVEDVHEHIATLKGYALAK